MNKKYQNLLGLFFLIASSFLAGGLAQRAGYFSKAKKMIFKPEIQEIAPTPTIIPTKIPTETLDLENSFYKYEIVNDVSIVSLNQKRLLESDTSTLRFLIAGHIYGKHLDDDFHPAMSFIRNLSYFQNLDLDMLFFLGDTSRNHYQNDFDDLEYFILDHINVPVFNAVGNHDMKYRENYLERYGRTVFAFVYKSNLFVILDTTIISADLSPEEVHFVETLVNQFANDPEISNIHIFMHHVLFLEDEEITGNHLASPNAGSGGSERFGELLKRVVYPASAIKSFYCIKKILTMT